MADVQTSFTMSTTSTDGKKSTKSVTNISETASDGAILNLATALNNVTTNTLGTVAKVIKKELETVLYWNYILTVTLEENSSGAITKVDNYNYNVDLSKLADEESTIWDNPYVNVAIKPSSSSGAKAIGYTSYTFESTAVFANSFPALQCNEDYSFRVFFLREDANDTDYTAKLTFPQIKVTSENVTKYIPPLTFTFNVTKGV